MADITVTPASVLASSAALCLSGIAGATITAGQPLYKDAADSNKLKPADANDTAAKAAVVGIALNGASAGQPVKYAYEDSAFTPGAAMTTGHVYALSATPGGIAPVADLATGHYPSVLLVATSESVAALRILNGSAARA